MPSYDEIIHQSAAAEAKDLAAENFEAKTALDYFLIAVSTFGVGYLPLAPGTFGSLVGLAIYLAVWQIETNFGVYFLHRGWNAAQITAWIDAFNVVVFIAFCLLSVWASSRATRIFRDKDPQKVVVDEVIGQILVFMFVPFDVHWYFVLSGFLLFRLFDIWKPYPIDSLQNLPAGIGVCADDILAGVYGGVCLSIIYAIYLSL